MPYNPAMSVPVVGYTDPSIRKRMQRVKKVRPRMTMSEQISRCLEIGLPFLEKEVGIKSGVPAKV